MNMATIATGPSAASSKPRRPPRSSPSRATSVPTKPAAINAVEGRGRSVTADVRIPREGRRRTPAHHARSGRGTQHTQEPGRLREEGREPRVQRPRRQRRRRDVPRHRAGRGAQVVEGANAITTAEVQDGDLYVSVSIASLEVRTVGGGTKLRRSPRGLDILGVSGGGDPPAPTPTPSPDASPSPSVPSRANSPFSPRSPRGTSPAPTPNSVGNCMHGGCCPTAIHRFRVRRPYSNHERTVSRDTTRLRDTRIQRISRTYYQRLVQSRTCLREGCCAISGPIDSV